MNTFPASFQCIASGEDSRYCIRLARGGAGRKRGGVGVGDVYRLGRGVYITQYGACISGYLSAAAYVLYTRLMIDDHHWGVLSPALQPYGSRLSITPHPHIHHTLKHSGKRHANSYTATQERDDDFFSPALPKATVVILIACPNCITLVIYSRGVFEFTAKRSNLDAHPSLECSDSKPRRLRKLSF